MIYLSAISDFPEIARSAAQRRVKSSAGSAAFKALVNLSKFLENLRDVIKLYRPYEDGSSEISKMMAEKRIS